MSVHRLVWGMSFVGSSLIAGAYWLWLDDWRSAVAPAAIAVVAGLVSLNFRCPRCRSDIDRSVEGGYGHGMTVPKTCVVCGRSKKGVWPFQWLLAPDRKR